MFYLYGMRAFYFTGKSAGDIRRTDSGHSALNPGVKKGEEK